MTCLLLSLTPDPRQLILHTLAAPVCLKLHLPVTLFIRNFQCAFAFMKNSSNSSTGVWCLWQCDTFTYLINSNYSFHLFPSPTLVPTTSVPRSSSLSSTLHDSLQVPCYLPLFLCICHFLCLDPSVLTFIYVSRSILFLCWPPKIIISDTFFDPHTIPF